MTKNKHIKTYSDNDLKTMRENGEDKTDWQKVNNNSENEDDDIVGLDWSQAQIVIPENKKHINLRVDADVLRFFKNQGKGYQTRMNAVLRSYMQSQHQYTPPEHS